MAKFKFEYGVMNCGKTQELIRIWNAYTKFGAEPDNILVLTSRKDTRSGESFVKSRNGQQVSATYIEDFYQDEEVSGMDSLSQLTTYIMNLALNNKEKPRCILVDEIQFMTSQQVQYIKYVSLETNTPVIAFGLLKDFQNNLFDGSQEAIVVAEELMEIITICDHDGCNKKAIMNIRVDSNNRKIEDGDQIVVDGKAIYKSVCHKHWINWEGDSKNDKQDQ